jgi:hypothetical protein
VPRVLRLVDDTHAAATQFFEDAIVPTWSDQSSAGTLALVMLGPGRRAVNERNFERNFVLSEICRAGTRQMRKTTKVYKSRLTSNPQFVRPDAPLDNRSRPRACPATVCRLSPSKKADKRLVGCILRRADRVLRR